MAIISRRSFTLAGAGAAAALAGPLLAAPRLLAQSGAKVVVIGGGFGGATVAHYLRKDAPGLSVTLVEPKQEFTSCMFSNLFLAGIRSLESITHTYQGLTQIGIRVVHDTATAVDTGKRLVMLAGGATLPYDALVVSPGIDIKHASVPGYSEAASEAMPHAWQGGQQAALLRRQIEAMEDGGVVVIAPPKGTYRCPPGPYERACLVAYWLKKKKPRSKVVVLEPKTAIAKQALFEEAFAEHYKGIIDFRKSTEIDSFALQRVDAGAMTVTSRGETIKAAVANIIPEQTAGRIAHATGLVEGDWCPVDPVSFESRKAKSVYVIGDAAAADPMPKSGFSANSQAKLVANDIASRLAGAQKFPPRLRNTCWSSLSQANTVKISAAYAVKKGQLTAVNSFSSKPGETVLERARNTGEYLGWYVNITADAFAKG